MYMNLKLGGLLPRPLDKRNGTKITLFFLSRAPTHHNLTSNLRFLYELKHKALFPKLSVGFSIFDSV